MIDHACQISGSETIVDIDNADAAGTGIKHGKQSGKPAKIRAIADAGRHRDHRAVCHSANHTCQRALHSCDCDDYPGAHDIIYMAHQAVHPCNAHVIKANHFISIDFRGLRRFLRYRHIAGSSGGNDNLSDSIRFRHLSDSANLRKTVIMKIQFFCHIIRCFLGHSGDQNRLFPFPYHFRSNPADLLRRFTSAINDFCRSLTDAAVGIQLGKSHFLIWFRLDLEHRLLRFCGSVSHLLQQLFQFFLVHPVCQLRIYLSFSTKEPFSSLTVPLPVCMLSSYFGSSSLDASSIS